MRYLAVSEKLTAAFDAENLIAAIAVVLHQGSTWATGVARSKELADVDDPLRTLQGLDTVRDNGSYPDDDGRSWRLFSLFSETLAGPLSLPVRVHVCSTGFPVRVPDDDLAPSVWWRDLQQQRAGSVARNRVIAVRVASDVSVGRFPLVIASRIETLNALSEELTNQGLKAVQLARDTLDSVRAGQYDVALVTRAFAGAHVDRVKAVHIVDAGLLKLDTIAQYVGRARRRFEGATEVLVYDWADHGDPVVSNMLARRTVAYRRLGYTVVVEPGESII